MFLDHRVRWNNALFYSDYKDIQLDIIVPGQPDPTLTETTNAGKARVAGDETELNFAVTESFVNCFRNVSIDCGWTSASAIFRSASVSGIPARILATFSGG